MSTIAADSTTPKDHRLGRNRNEDLTDQILEATGQLLLEKGYDKVGIREVAERSGAGTGAIYRRWATKELLISEAIRCLAVPKIQPTDDPLADLEAMYSFRINMALQQPDLLPSIVSAMRSSPEVADAVEESSTNANIRNAVGRALGFDHPYLDLITDIVPGVLLHRTTIGKPIDLDEVLNGTLAIIKTQQPRDSD